MRWGACCVLGVAGWMGLAASGFGQVPAVAAAPAVSLERARALMAGGDFGAAEALLREETQREAGSAEAAYLYGLVLLRVNKPKESLAEYTRAASLRVPTAEELRHVAEDYVLLNDYSDADRWMLRAVQMNGKDADSWYGLGRIRYTEQRFQDAVDCFQKVLELSPRMVKAADNLGLAYVGLNRRDEAIAAFQRALEWQKEGSGSTSGRLSEQPMLNLAIVYLEMERLDDALPLLRQAAGIAPKDPRIREQLGQALVQKGELAEAREEFQAAVTLDPEKASYHFLLGRVDHRLGLEVESKAEMARAAALNGTHSTPDGH